MHLLLSLRRRRPQRPIPPAEPTVIGAVEAAQPAPCEPAIVAGDRLLDLALVMRELWLPGAAFVGDGHRARSMVLAALLRLFPDRAEPSVAACLRRHCPAGRCEDCPADAKTPERHLDSFLDGLPRPTVRVRVPAGEVERLIADLSVPAGGGF